MKAPSSHMKKYRIRKEYRTRVRLTCGGCLTIIIVIIAAICLLNKATEKRG